tara:strand:+ start:3198 stop:3809 length:612 start_codon:yes stop_codon:yes gene_type:complete
MSAEQDLINKLIISKQIMQKHDTMGRGGSQSIPSQSMSSPMVEDFTPVSANYNLPQEYLTEAPTQKMNTEVPSADRIANSKLPDEIKRLMMEHPIQQPNSSVNNSVLSSDLIEKASRLMNTKANGDLINENVPKRTQQIQQTQPSVSISADDIRSIVRETVQDVLKENGLLVESTKKSNEVFKFRVGQHIFEGKLLRVRKVSE